MNNCFPHSQHPLPLLHHGRRCHRAGCHRGSVRRPGAAAQEPQAVGGALGEHLAARWTFCLFNLEFRA